VKLMLENVSADECAYVRFGSKADMTACLHDVRFTPIADINRDIRGRNAGSNARGSTRKLGVMGIAFDYARPLFPAFQHAGISPRVNHRVLRTRYNL
jgi:hypothetical protein